MNIYLIVLGVELKESLKRVITPPSLVNNHHQKRQIEDFINNFDDKAIIIDVGTSNRKLGRNVLNLDIEKHPNVDIVADIHKIPLQNAYADGIIVTGVFEHIEDPQIAVSELFRILKKDGLIYASVPFMQPYHPHPTDFQRYSIEGIRNLFKDFEEIKLFNTRGSGSAVSWILQEFFSMLFCFNDPTLYKLFKVIFGWIFFPLKYFDGLIKNNEYDKYITSGFTFIGRKNF